MTESDLLSGVTDKCLTTHSSPLTSPINPLALTISDAAALLSKAGGRLISQEQINADVAAGAPLNGDSTMNLVTYTAWLVQERGGQSRGD